MSRQILIAALAVFILTPVYAAADEGSSRTGNGGMELAELLHDKSVIDDKAYAELKEAHAENPLYGISPAGSLLLGYTLWNEMPYDEVISYPGSPHDQRGFHMRKAELGLKGRAYYDWLRFKILAVAEPNEDGQVEFGVDTAYVEAFWSYAPCDNLKMGHGFTLGGMKLPFSRQNLNSTAKLQLINRAMVVEETPIEYDLGATLDADYNYANDLARLKIRLGAFNGNSDGDYGPDNNDNLQYTARARLDLIDAMSAGEGDLETAGDKKPRLSLGYSFLQNNDIDRIVKAWGVDAEVRGYGFSALAEYIATRFEPDLAETMTASQYAEDWETDGWFVQGGYYIRWIKVEPAVRYEEYNLDLLSDVMPRRRLAATTYGLNWHIANPHHAKLQANYTQRAELEGMPEEDNDSFYLQAALSF